LKQEKGARRDPRIEVGRLVIRLLQRPTARQIGVVRVDVIELVAELDKLPSREVRDAVEALLEIVGSPEVARQAERRGTSADEDRRACGGDNFAEPVVDGADGRIAGDAAVCRQEQVRDLGLAGIVRAIEVARTDLDLLHAARGYSGEQCLQSFRLRAWTRSVEDDVAGGSGEAADVDSRSRLAAAEVEGEAGDALNDVEG